MEGFVSKIVLFNTPNNTVGVTVGNITTTSGVVKIDSLPSFLKNDCVSVTATATVAEVAQVVKIGETVAPVIAALTKYQLKIGNTGNRVEGAQSQMKSYGYTAPAVLGSTAGIDRHNAYISLAYKINNDKSAKCVAQVIQTLPQTTNAAAYAAGEIITGTTSGAKAVVLSGTTATLTVNSTGVGGNGLMFTTGEAATGSITGVTTTMGTVVVGVGLRIIDNGSYYDIENLNQGANTVFPTLGFVATNVVISTAAVYAQGRGADMLKRVYVKEKTSENRASGEYAFASNEVPVAANNYTRYDLVIRPAASASALNEMVGRTEFRYTVYAYTGAADYADFNTDILAAHA